MPDQIHTESLVNMIPYTICQIKYIHETLYFMLDQIHTESLVNIRLYTVCKIKYIH